MNRFTALVIAVVSVGLYFYDRARASAEEQRSIAVLPFVGRSIPEIADRF